MIAISEQVKAHLADDVRAMERARCENIVRNHYFFVEDLDPYSVANHLPETIELLTRNCLNAVSRMFERLEKDSDALTGSLGVRKDDALLHVKALDDSYSILALDFESGARIVYKDAPSAIYGLWEYAARDAGLQAMKTLCRGEYLYSDFIERAPLGQGQAPGDYYYHLGKLFALSHLFGAGDFQGANLYPVGAMPIAIDCDMMMHLGQPYWRIAASGCLPYDDGGKYQKPAQMTPFYHGRTCPFDEDGTIHLFEDYVEDIKRGYEDCALHAIPALRDEFLQRAQGVRYRYLPTNTRIYETMFRQRIVFGYRESKSDNALIRAITESISRLDHLKFYVEVDGNTLYYGNMPIGAVNTVTTELLEYRFDAIPTTEDIGIQFEDIDNAANMLRAAHEQKRTSSEVS